MKKVVQLHLGQCVSLIQEVRHWYGHNKIIKYRSNLIVHSSKKFIFSLIIYVVQYFSWENKVVIHE